MQSSLQNQIDNDPKWKSFLAAFGKAPVEQNAEREAAITQSFEATEDALKIAGPGETAKKYGLALQVLRNEMTQIGQIDRPEERYRKLEPLMKKAADLAARAAKEKEKITKKVGSEKISGASSVEFLIGQAEQAMLNPSWHDTIDKLLAPVKQAFDGAKNKKDAKGFYDAIQEIDTLDLDNALKEYQSFKNKLAMPENYLRGIKTSLDQIPDSEHDSKEYKAALSSFNDLTGTYDKLVLSVDANTFDGEVKLLRRDLLQLFKDVDKIKQPFNKDITEKADKQRTDRKLADLLAPINAVLKQAKDVLKTCQAPFLKDALDTLADEAKKLDTAQSDALDLDPFDAQALAIGKIDPRPVIVAMTKVQDAMKGVPRMLGGLETLLAGVDAKKLKGDLAGELETLKSDFEDAAQTEDGKGLEAIKARLIAMTKEVAKATKQDEYALLLETQYGVTVERTGPKFPPNLKGTYEAFDMVPDSHVGQDKLQKIVFDYGKAIPYGEYGDSVVTMQGKLFDFTKLTFAAYKLKYDEPPFVVDGKEYAPNAFKVTMLHEIGHSIDDRHDIMDGYQANAGYGQWTDETATSVTDACCNQLAGDLKVTDTDKIAAIRSCIDLAVTKEAPKKRPDALSDTEWKGVQTYCKTVALSRSDKEPWYKWKKAINIGGRIYQEAYDGRWVSYMAADRTTALTVSSYQWRAPGEWFACVYSVAWMKKETPNAFKGMLDDWLPPAA